MGYFPTQSPPSPSAICHQEDEEAFVFLPLEEDEEALPLEEDEDSVAVVDFRLQMSISPEFSLTTPCTLTRTHFIKAKQ